MTMPQSDLNWTCHCPHQDIHEPVLLVLPGFVQFALPEQLVQLEPLVPPVLPGLLELPAPVRCALLVIEICIEQEPKCNSF